MSPDQEDWIRGLPDALCSYMERLRREPGAWTFYPCLRGRSRVGGKLSLGFSCFALKISYMLRHWDALPDAARHEWVSFIQSFQKDGPVQDPVARNAFVDDAIYEYLQKPAPFYRRWLRRAALPISEEGIQAVLRAETKQAIATLAEVGASPHVPYEWLPRGSGETASFLSSLDWTKPWGAGAHFAALCVLLRTQGSSFLDEGERAGIAADCARFIEAHVDSGSGAYFTGPTPTHEMLVNGAMKVLSGLDWLEVPIHYPERLIDTCLAAQPEPEGCHLVDAVYVLRRCGLSSEHRKSEVQAYCLKVLEMIRRHYVPEEGGFSYGIGRSQTSYYGVPVSSGQATGDIHGTVLLLWALTMILEVLDKNSPEWRVLRP